MTPQFHITVEGQGDVTAQIRERLLSLRVRDEVGYRSDAVEIRLDDRGGEINLPRRGVALEVKLGYDQVPEAERRNGLKNGLVAMGRYVVDAVEMSGPPETLTLRATAADMRTGAKQRKTRSWDQVTIGDLVATIAQEHDLAPAVAGGLSAIVMPHVDQVDESDLHLLTRLGERYDAVARPAGGRLVFTRRGAAQSATGRAVTPLRVLRERAGDYRVNIDDRRRYGSVKAYWYDTAAGQRRAVTAGSGEPVYALRDDQVDAATARYAAQARLDALNRDAVALSLSLRPGAPTVTAESLLTLSGFRAGVNGRWLVTAASHELSDTGLTTEVEAERPT